MEPRTSNLEQKAGQYYLLEKLAQGGMAEIYKGLAYDMAGIKKTVCIKKILSHIAASREFIDMLVNEAKIAVKLNHGNIAQIFDLGKAGDDYFIVMEFVEGQNLSRIYKKALRQGKKIPLPIVCTVIAEVASGLNYMHRKTDEEGNSLHVIHRDISPQNIMVSYSGTVKIIDFGIAKAAVKIGHTDSGILKGKFAYMSPEQARGDKIDHRSDIFSLGIIFHELLTGKRLFKASDNKQTLKNVRKAKVLPPSELNPELPAEMDAIALKALAKDRRHRYSFPSDFQEDLSKFLHNRYPDFKPSQIADFVRNLFQDELALHKALADSEGATPHLILDKTRSTSETKEEPFEVTSGGAASIDWREFMLEEDWPEEKEAEKQEARNREEKEESPIEPAEAIEKSERTDKKWFGKLSFRKQSIVLSLGLALLLAMSAAGYFGWQYFKTSEVRGQKSEVGGQTSDIRLPTSEIKAQTLFATVVIESNPPGASIYLDDKETGLTTPTKLTDLPPDQKHVLGLYLTNYKYFKTDFETKAGETQNFHVELAMDYGSLKVLSQPPGAKVSVNGSMIGLTPLIKEEMKPGAIVKVEVHQDGFAAFVQEIQIAAGKEHLVDAHLERLPSLPVQPTPPIIKEDEQESQTGTNRTDDHY